jgi:signal transduction histidine kinase
VAPLLNLCKQREAPEQPPVRAALLGRCNRAFAKINAGFEDRDRILRAMRTGSVIGLGVLMIVSVGLGWLFSGRALRPVRSITEAARRASELRLGQRLALSGPDDELKHLADTFDVMLERLDAAFTSQKRFVANAAHELRTPLTAMRTAIEVTLAKPSRTPEQLEAMAARVQRSVDRAEAIIDALLALAVSEVGPPAIEQRGLTIDAALAPAPTQGDRVLLERMVANLVDNAVRHNHSGGWIGIRTLQRDGGAVLEMANTGPSIPAERIPTLFEPFARAEPRLNPADGVGLGLSIAQAIAGAHDAAIAARARDGGGLELSVTLPG